MNVHLATVAACEPPTTLDLRGIKAFSNYYYCIYCVHKLSNPAISLWKHRGLRTRVKSCHSTLPFSLKCPHATLLPKKTQRNRFMTISSSVFGKPYITTSNKLYVKVTTYRYFFGIIASKNNLQNWNNRAVWLWRMFCQVFWTKTAMSNWVRERKKCPPNRTSLSGAKRNCKSLWWWKSGSFCGAWIRLLCACLAMYPSGHNAGTTGSNSLWCHILILYTNAISRKISELSK